MCVSLSDLEDFAEGSAADELEKVKVARGEWDFGGWRLFVGDLEVEVARYFFVFDGLESDDNG